MNRFIILIAFCLGCNNAIASKLDPYSEYDPVQGLYIKKFSPPIHENLTIKSLNLARSLFSIDINQEDLITGVRWNDDPLQFFKSHPTDFLIYYTDSCGRPEEIDPSWDLLYRTHCGDMQFLHSMASTENEKAIETKNKILMWAEFTFKVASGEIPKNRRFEKLDLLLEKESGKLFKQLITNNGRVRVEWQPEDLFTLECDRDFSIFSWLQSILTNHRPSSLSCIDFHNEHNTNTIQDIALGSFIHLLQDSFSDSHVTRNPTYTEKVSIIKNRGSIKEFLIYTKQDEKEHSIADMTFKDSDFTSQNYTLDLIEITKNIIVLANEQRTESVDNWPKVKEILNQTFNLENPSQLPSGGKY